MHQPIDDLEPSLEDVKYALSYDPLFFPEGQSYEILEIVNG